MSGGRDLLCQLRLGPAELPDGTDVPGFLLERQLRLHNDHVLCPADGHGRSHGLRGAFIGAVEVPHPAQTSGREPGGVRVSALEILRGGDCRALLRPAADYTANVAVQLHLRQICRHQRVQRREYGAVIYRFSDVHEILSFPALSPLFCDRAERNTGGCSRASLCFAHFYIDRFPYSAL